MENGKISEARRRSEDPAQEHLRSQKDLWNAATKSLIAKLIAFKRALNGRGDPKAGLPASHITEPFPDQIGSYLNHLADQYQSVIQGAENIVKEQEHYSETRRKRQPQSHVATPIAPAPPQQMAAADDGFVSEASWVGSRFWAKHFGLRGENKPYLKSLINAGDLLNEALEEMEDILSTNDPNAAFYAFNLLVRATNGSAQKMAIQMEQLAAIGDPPTPTIAPRSEPTPEAPALEPTAPEPAAPPESIKPEIAKSIEAPAPMVSNPKSGVEEVIADYLAIVNDIANMDIVLGYVLQNNSSYAKQLDKLERAVRPGNSVLKGIKKIQSGQARVPEIHVTLQKVHNLTEAYDNLLAICSTMMGATKTYPNFAEMVSKINVKSDDTNDAKSPLTWFRKKWLESKLDFLRTNRELDEMKIEAIRGSEKCQDHLDKFLNAIEKPGTPVQEVADKFVAVKTSYSTFIASMINVARIHNTLFLEEKSNKTRKDVIMHPIEKESITQLATLNLKIFGI